VGTCSVREYVSTREYVNRAVGKYASLGYPLSRAPSPPLHPEQARDAEDRYFDDSDDSAPSAPTVAREATTRMDEDLDY
jgi:hypothetical protein